MSESRPGVVFDINVYVEAIAGPASLWPLLQEVPPRSTNAAADCLSLAFDTDVFRLFASPHILTNLARVLRRLGVSDLTVREACDTVLELIEITGGAVIEPPRTVFDVPDWGDNLIMDLAVAVNAILVVSDDTDLPLYPPGKTASQSFARTSLSHGYCHPDAVGEMNP